MSKTITLMDGGVGTSLWEIAEQNDIPKKAVWAYNLERPEIVGEMHRQMIEAGSKIIMANTFSANRLAVQRTDYAVADVIREGVRIAKACAAGTDVKVGMSAGPLTKLLVRPGRRLKPDMVSLEECSEIYAEMFAAGIGAGAEMVMLQTFMDLAMIKAAAIEAKKYDLPVFCTLTFERGGVTMMGNRVSQVCEELKAVGVDAVGMNCSLGPDLALPIIREFAETTELPLVFKPNAGMPILAQSGESSYDCGPEEFAEKIKPALQYVSYIGGCCGCNRDYIRAIHALL